MKKLLEYRTKVEDTQVIHATPTIPILFYDLANSGLATEKIVLYSDNSFVFKTKGILIPHFISPTIGEGNSFIKLPIPRRVLGLLGLPKLLEKLKSPENIGYILEKLGISDFINNLNEEDEELRTFATNIFVNKFYTAFINKIDLVDIKEDKENSGIIIKTIPNIDLSPLIKMYSKIMLKQNKQYMSKVSNEELCFTPIENNTCSNFFKFIILINTFAKELRATLVNILLGEIEKKTEINVENFSLESQSNSGIMVDKDEVIYYNNVIVSDGLGYIIQEPVTKISYLAFSNKEYGFLPKLIESLQFTSLFKEVFTIEE